MKALQREQTLRNLQTALAAGEAKLERRQIALTFIRQP
jgi:hypothetical protein